MKIAVLGTGAVGQSVGGRLAELGHDVTFGTRDPVATLARTGPDGHGTPPISAWLADRPAVVLATFSDAARAADVVINATSGDGSLPAVTAAAEGGNLDGKVLMDVSNPLDFSGGFPPTLSVKDTDSLAEQLQRAVPAAKVVKTLNTINSNLMVDPRQLAGGDHTVFVSGDDAGAKATVTGLLREFGWTDVLDLGDLSTARGSEMYVGFWVRLLSAVGGGANFNIKVVR